MIALGLTLFSGRVGEGVETPPPPPPPPSLAGLVLVTGNSHSIGRASASGDVFDARVQQWTQAGEIAAISGAMLDVGDGSGNTQGGDLSPMLAFLNALAASRSDLTKIVVVAAGQGSTGFVDGTWAVDHIGDPNRLAGACARWDAAHAALVGQGFQVDPICAVHLSARPDSTTVADPVSHGFADKVAAAHGYATAQNGYVDHLRASLAGVDGTFPVLIGNAMTQSQQSTDIDYAYASAAGNGIARRRAHCWFLDPVNDWGDGEAAALPVAPFDGVHADRAGTLTEGRLLAAALPRAAANTAPNAPFSTLDSWTDMVSLYDFRSGTGLDQAGALDLTQAGGDPGLVRFSPGFGTFAYDRPAGSDRTYWRPAPLPPTYTIVIRCLVDSLNTTGFLMNTEGSGAEQQRFYLSGSGALRAGNGGNTEIDVPGGLSVDTVYTLSLSYDGTTLRLYRDATLLDSQPAAAPDQTRGLYLGAQNSPTGAFQGDMQACAIYGAALSDAQIAALAGADYGL